MRHYLDRLLDLVFVGNRAGEFEGAHQHCPVATYRMGGLGAEAAGLHAVRARWTDLTLRQRIHRAARVAESAKYVARALHDNREIDACFAGGLALANAGDTENEQQIRLA